MRRTIASGFGKLGIPIAAVALLGSGGSAQLLRAQLDRPEPPAQSTLAGPVESANPGAVAIRLSLAPEGNFARFRVREQLANIDFPSDAVGETTAIEGGMTIAEDGMVVADESRFTIDVTTLTTDTGMRDRYIQRNTLETADHPTAEFAPTAIEGLSLPLPTSGEATFQIAGDLTIHGVTKPTRWDVTAQFDGNAITGLAQTSFTFAEFEMRIPSVARVLSVDDDIRLEYQFNLIAATVSPE